MTKEKFNVGVNLDNTNKVELTSQGKKDLEEKLRILINDERPKIQEELSEARAQGDLSENAEYDAAKNKQAETEAEIARIEDILTRVKVVKTSKSINEINIGHIITYEKGSKKEKIIIVPDAEYDPLAEILKVGVGTIFAQAIIGKKVGDEIIIPAEKQFKVKILLIE